jgi:hypothetical protein
MTKAGSALTIAAAFGGLAIKPTVTLRPDEVDIAVSPDLLLAHFRRTFADDQERIIADEGHRLVRRFSGQAGPFPYRTIEIVTHHPDAVTFEHIAGPFSHCHERFQLDAIPTGTRMTHTGSFRLRGGLFTAPLALTSVRRAFETHVRQHLEALAEELRSGDGHCGPP